MGQLGKLECYALLNRKPMKMFKNYQMSVCLVGERDQQQLWRVLDTLLCVLCSLKAVLG